MLRWLFRSKDRNLAAASVSDELISLARDEIKPFLMIEHGLPQVDWGMADVWIERKSQGQNDAQDAGRTITDLRRAVAAAWLNELRDALQTDSRRWRHAQVEGLAPLGDNGHLSQRIAKWSDRSISIIGTALREVRGEPATNPIPPIAIIVLGTSDEYYSFISHFYEEGEFATSGGIYLRAGVESSFPMIALNGQLNLHIEQSIAHELTHHALKPEQPELFEGLPLWAEEGFTQMMEAHVTRQSHFAFNREMLARHRALWEEIGFDGFATGETFHSPEGEQQELSYNLAEAITRWLATTRRKDFFAFARACRNTNVDHETAAREHLDGTVQEIADAYVFRRDV